jgi:hypothetical protein
MFSLHLYELFVINEKLIQNLLYLIVEHDSYAIYVYYYFNLDFIKVFLIVNMYVRERLPFLDEDLEILIKKFKVNEIYFLALNIILTIIINFYL